ncbi:MAG: hypothetical protein WCP69_15360 [Bacteroidota bacterium]
MKKIYVIILSGITAIIIGYFIYTISFSIFNARHVVFNNYQKYLWLFSDNVKNEIDTNFAIGEEGDYDSQYTYILKNRDYFFTIWEFNRLGNIDIAKIPINNNCNLDNLEIDLGEILNKNCPPFPMTKVKFKLPFQNHLIVNLNEHSFIEKPIESKNYRGFFGKINKMSFSNFVGEDLILFDYGKTDQLTLFIMYKKNNSFYIILINSKKIFDESIINILNLE